MNNMCKCVITQSSSISITSIWRRYFFQILYLLAFYMHHCFQGGVTSWHIIIQKIGIHIKTVIQNIIKSYNFFIDFLVQATEDDSARRLVGNPFISSFVILSVRTPAAISLWSSRAGPITIIAHAILRIDKKKNNLNNFAPKRTPAYCFFPFGSFKRLKTVTSVFLGDFHFFLKWYSNDLYLLYIYLILLSIARENNAPFPDTAE